MSDVPAQVRREIIAELIELAREHAAGHDDLKRQAEEYGREDMRIRAECNQNAWMEVARVLRFDLRARTSPVGRT